jgi:ABC-type Zn uptake system ZnuABC Zn-binding protein ZnuA
VVDTSTGVEPREGGGDEHAGETEGSEPDGEHRDEDDHAEDPHIWQSPRNAMVMVDNIEAAFVDADPDGAATYEANAAAYRTTLEELDRSVEEQLAGLTNRKVVTNHDALGYYIDRYDLEFVGSIIPSFDSTAELSAADIDAIVAQIRDNDVKAVFSESSIPPKTAEAIGTEAGVTVVAGEDALYGDSLGPDGSGAATYVEMIRHNTEELVANLR